MSARLGCLLLLVLLIACWVNELQARIDEPVTLHETVSLGDRVSLISVRYRAEIREQIEAPRATVGETLPEVTSFDTTDALTLDLRQTLPLFLTSADPCYLFMTLRR